MVAQVELEAAPPLLAGGRVKKADWRQTAQQKEEGRWGCAFDAVAPGVALDDDALLPVVVVPCGFDASLGAVGAPLEVALTTG